MASESGAIKEVKVAVVKVTKYEIIKTYYERNEDGTESGGSESFGTFGREDTALMVADLIRREGK